MKKIFTTLVAVIAIAQFSYAQYWSGGPTGPISYSSGNVGIGTSSPAFPLHVLGTNGNYVAFDVNSNGNSKIIVTGSGAAIDPSIVFTNSTGSIANTIDGNLSSGFYFDSGPGEYHFRNSGGTDRVTILSGGNVGIGTNSPGKKLDVNGDARILGTNKLYLGSPTFEATLGYNGNGNLDITPRSGYHTVFTTGNVGIGTSNPFLPLEVEGTIYSATPISNTVGIGTSTANNSNYNFIGYQGYWGLRTATNTSYNLDVYNGGNPITAITVLQGGYVGIGTTTPQEAYQ